jgi:hypothetical protein
MARDNALGIVLGVLAIASSAGAAPCPTPYVHTHRSLADAKAALGATPPQAAPDLDAKGSAFFVDVPVDSPEGTDQIIYKVVAIFVQHDRIIVVDELARWTSVIPPPGGRSPTTPAQSIQIDRGMARLEIRGMRPSIVDVAHAQFLGCVK